MRHHVQTRRFLNLRGHHGGAYITASVPDSTTCPKDCEHRAFDECRDAEIVIADCRRSIYLEVDLHTRSHIRNSLHKVGVMIEVLEQVRAALLVEDARRRTRNRKGTAI